uniref:Uncharacterized protein LOC104266168 n=1 Tax=Phallusia mammillata TaxID=59560 RepID=A0A6F9DJW5_9ASCI|nr:uncharacterized protein LOC104266168 [Phallusia mammillata]
MVLGISFWFCPSFTRVGGWVGVSSVRRREFMTVMLVLCILMFGACIALITLSLIELTSNPYPLPRCSNAYSSCFTEAARTTELSDDGVCTAYLNQCYEATVWTSIYFALVIILMIATGAVVAFLLYNFKFTAGDLIEKYLVQSKELEQVMATARTGSVSQKRNAAFELATMAASADDNKFQIVTGGLEILISLALNPDTTTQEYATEAIAECLTVPAIQDQFVAVGGMKTLTALLHTKNARTVREAITAVSYVVSDSDENKPAVLAEHGLDDLAHACKYANTSNRKLLASIFLELAYYSDTRYIFFT